MFFGMGKFGKVLSASSLAPAFSLNLLASVLDGRVTFARASTATDGVYTDATGSGYNSFAVNAPRISTARGLLIEGASTNNLLNSDTPATQTTGSLATGAYTLWVVGSGNATPSAGTATITGAATASAGNPVIFNVTVAGTVTVTVAGSLTRFQLEPGSMPTSYIPAAGAIANRSGDVATVATGAWFSTVAGTLFSESLLLSNTTGSPILVEISDTTVSNRILSSLNATMHAQSNVVNAGSSVASVATTNAAPIGSAFRAAMSYSALGQAEALAGVVTARAALPAGNIPGGLTSMKLGRKADNTNSLNGYVRKVAYYNRDTYPALLAQMTA